MNEPSKTPQTRRRFLKTMTPAAAAMAAAGALAQPGERAGTFVPMDVKWPPAWLTWVASTTACLKALDVDCDLADVAGMSGYAFVLNVPEGVNISGPTAFPWDLLNEGVRMLGRTTLVYRSPEFEGEEGPPIVVTPRTREHCRMAYEIVAREIEAGRPCVVWGAYQPEFAVVVGVEDLKYHVKSSRQVLRQAEEPIPFDGVIAPSGVYVLAFPTAAQVPQDGADLFAIRQADALLRGAGPFAPHLGLSAYDTWISALEENRAEPFGNAYCAQCFAEGRRLARQFLAKVALRRPTITEPLNRAVAAYFEAEYAMADLAKLFPFPEGGQLADPAKRTQGAELLRAAKDAETRAAAAIAEAVGTGLAGQP